MSPRTKRALASVVPPFLRTIGKALKARLTDSVDHFEHAPDGWSTPLPAGRCSEDYWNAFIELEEANCKALIARVQAGGPVLAPAGDFKDVLFGYVLALAVRETEKVSVLDYGANLGDYYWLGQALVPGIEMEYHCKELPEVAEAGRRMTPEVTWHTGNACLDRRYDVVMFSSSLQYLRDWRDVLQRATHSTARYLWLSDVPAVRAVPAYVITQRSMGMTNLQYQLNRSEVVAIVEAAGLRLVREFEMGVLPSVTNAPEQPVCVGWLFQR